MSYILKEDVSVELKQKYKQGYLAEMLGKRQPYISMLLNRKINCPKTTAYAFTKMIDSEKEISDLFERV